MSMNEFRRLAARIDQHMQQLSAQDVNDDAAIINRMVGYMPDLHKIWTGTSDDQLLALTREFPGFYRYALAMEEASEAERKKPSRPYDGMAQFSEHHKQQANQLLTAAAALERSYQLLPGSPKLRVFQPQFHELNSLHQRWIADLESFTQSLFTHGVEPKAVEYVNTAFGQLAERIKKAAG
jgi:ATP-dependent helicase/DNAse subunit B